MNLLDRIKSLVLPTTSITARATGYFALGFTATLVTYLTPVSSGSIETIAKILGLGSEPIGWAALISSELIASIILSNSSYFISNKFFKQVGLDVSSNFLIRWLKQRHDILRRGLNIGLVQLLPLYLLANSRIWLLEPKLLLNINNIIPWYISFPLTVGVFSTTGIALTTIMHLIGNQKRSLRDAANIGALLAAITTGVMCFIISPSNFGIASMIVSAIVLPLSHMTGGALFLIARKGAIEINSKARETESIKQIEDNLEPAYLKIMQLLGSQRTQQTAQTIIEVVFLELAAYNFGLAVGGVNYEMGTDRSESAYSESLLLYRTVMALFNLEYFSVKTHLGLGDSRNSNPAILPVYDPENEQLLITSSVNSNVSFRQACVTR